MSEDKNEYTVASDSVLTYQQPLNITFQIPSGEWVMRITKDGVETNPNVSVDDGARAIFEALKPYLQALK